MCLWDYVEYSWDLFLRFFVGEYFDIDLLKIFFNMSYLFVKSDIFD